MLGTAGAATDTEAASVDNQTQNHSAERYRWAAGAVHARQFRWADGHSEPTVRHPQRQPTMNRRHPVL